MIKKIITILTLIIFTFSLVSCDKQEEKLVKYYKTTKVASGSINLEDNFVGYVESNIKTQLGTKQGGLIREIYVKEGDRVNVGDIIARFDNAEGSTSLANQENMLLQMQNLKNAVSKTYDSQIDVTKSLENQININLNGANNILSLTKNIKDKDLASINSQIETTKNALETTKIELEQTKLVFDTKEKNLYSNAKNAITSSMIIDTNTVKFADQLLGVINPTNDDNNDVFQDFLGAKNTNQKNDVINKFSEVYKDYLNYKNIYETTILNKDPSKEEIESTLVIGENFNNKLRDFLKDLYETVDNSIANEPTFSQNIINGHKQTISNFGNNIESALITVSGDYILGLKGIKQSIDSFNSEKEKALTLLQKKVDLANNNLDTITKNYEQAVEGNNLKITDVEIKTKEASEKLNELNKNRASIETNKNAKLSELDLETTKIEIGKDLSLVSINNSIVRSPISGVITKKFVEVGQVIVPSMPIVEISDNKDIKITFEIPDNTLSKIKLGDKVNTSIEGTDGFKDGIIKTIFPIKNEITKKTKIEISLLDPKNIIIGSIAKLYINDQSQNGIFIQNNSIIEKYMIPGVYIIKTDKKLGKIIEFRQIKILKQNNEFSLVEGLLPGEEIITDGKENLFDGEVLE
ncbi:MAG: efflux RND transporter periplasmic adaptor subunit [Candidatus Gracilibacteria bacterium]